jgi:Ca2+-binding RTX toxin-like protein
MAKFTGTPGNDSVDAILVPPFQGFSGGTLDELLDDAGDKFNGLAGRDRIFAGPGDDVLDGGADADLMVGALGDDRMIGGPGNDAVEGGGGDDVYEVDSGRFDIPAPRDVTRELPGGGHDTVRSTIDWSLDANVEDLVLVGTAANGTGNSENNEIEGNSAANILSGLDGNDVLNGEAGDDNIDGGAGNDQLLGGAGNDRMSGGPGNDFYEVENQGDRVF